MKFSFQFTVDIEPNAETANAVTRHLREQGIEVFMQLPRVSHWDSDECPKCQKYDDLGMSPCSCNLTREQFDRMFQCRKQVHSIESEILTAWNYDFSVRWELIRVAERLNGLIR